MCRVAVGMEKSGLTEQEGDRLAEGGGGFTVGGEGKRSQG